MLKTLIKSRLLALWASLSQGTKKKKTNATGIVLIVVFALLAVYMLGAISIMFFGLGFVMNEQGDSWAFFTLASLIASALCLFGSIFTTKTQIFESKDNDLLLSMPIPPKYILISRILVLLVVNYILEALVMLPAIVMYGITIGYTFVGFIFAILSFVLIPFVTLAISAIIAWIISFIASKIRNKTLVSTALFILFFGAYMYFCFSLGSFTGSGEEMNIDMSGLKNTFVFYYLGNSISNVNFLHFAFFALFAIIPSIVTFIVISRSFIKIITTKKTSKKIEYKQKTEKTNTPFISLVKKEIKRFFSSTAYIMNCGIGSIMLLILSILIAVKSPDILTAIELQFSDPTQAIPKELVYSFIPVVISIACGFISSMSLVSTPSISLENKNLWILQTLPIRPKTILFAKITNHMIICAPVSIISAIIACVSLKVNAFNTILAILYVFMMIAFTGYFGMFLGLKFPKFDWQNENVAVKQGFAIFGSMFGSMIYATILSAIMFLIAIFNPIVALIVTTLISLTLCVLFHLYFVYLAEKDFEKLKDK